MQLRFEYDPDADSILVRQVNARCAGDMCGAGSVMSIMLVVLCFSH